VYSKEELLTIGVLQRGSTHHWCNPERKYSPLVYSREEVLTIGVLQRGSTYHWCTSERLYLPLVYFREVVLTIGVGLLQIGKLLLTICVLQRKISTKEKEDE